jgi:hypothetical protein
MVAHSATYSWKYIGCLVNHYHAALTCRDSFYCVCWFTMMSYAFCVKCYANPLKFCHALLSDTGVGQQSLIITAAKFLCLFGPFLLPFLCSKFPCKWCHVVDIWRPCIGHTFIMYRLTSWCGREGFTGSSVWTYVPGVSIWVRSLSSKGHVFFVYFMQFYINVKLV